MWIYFLKPRNHAIINFLEFRRYYGKTVSLVPCTILAGDQLTWLHERVHKAGTYRQEQEPVPFEPHGILCDGYVKCGFRGAVCNIVIKIGRECYVYISSARRYCYNLLRLSRPEKRQESIDSVHNANNVDDELDRKHRVSHVCDSTALGIASILTNLSKVL